jgi:TrmH family RNA methyltransferase
MGIRELTSSANSLVKLFRRALPKGVTREGWLAVEGPHLVEEALEAASTATIHSVLVSESAMVKFTGLLKRLSPETEIAQVADKLFRQVADTQSPQGIAALVELARANLGDILQRRDVLVVVACGLQDPGNLGTILRSAEAFGASALVTLEDTVSPFNPKAVRASAGAIFRIPVVPKIKAENLVERLRASRVSIVAAERSSHTTIEHADLRGPVALLIGQEAAGLPGEIIRHADWRLSIPIREGTDSVNAATAASILLYESARQRGFRYSY